MPSLNALVSQPQNPDPPDVQGASGSGLDGAMQQQQGGPPQGGGTMQPPSHHEAVALLQHISAFDQRWREILKDPEIGKGNVRGKVYDMMADMMGEDYATLPQVMGLLKSMPTEPLEQKHWIEEHVANDQKAMQAVVQHHAQASPPPGKWQDEMAAAAPGDRASLVNGVVARYKAHPKKPTKMKGIPVRA